MKQILLTNDDGIQSPGLWAAAEALSSLGFVHVTAPRDQYSGAGRSLPSTSTCTIETHEVTVNNQPWKVYSVAGSPAQAVQHAILEVLPQPPDLVVAGINYGENVGTGITISGTVGAAMEGAAFGIPALAVSLETEPQHHYSHSLEVDFAIAAHFTALFAELLLARRFPPDVDLLKVDIPAGATLQTPWKLTRLSRRRYYDILAPERPSWDVPARPGYRRAEDYRHDPSDSDAYVLNVLGEVSVTPLSMDLTSRVDFLDLERLMRT